jgi:hypothetical protein
MPQGTKQSFYEIILVDQDIIMQSHPDIVQGYKVNGQAYGSGDIRVAGLDPLTQIDHTWRRISKSKQHGN